MTRFKLLLDLIRPVKGRLVLASVLTMVYTAFTLTPPLALRYLLDQVVKPKAWDLLLIAVSLVAVIPLWNAALAALNRFIIASLGQRLIVDLRTNLYRHVLTLGMEFHGRVGAGTIMNRLMTDVGLVQNLITGETLSVLSSSVALIFSVGMCFYLNWKLALVMVVMVVLYVINYYKFAVRIRQANLDLRQVMDEVAGQLQERIAGVRLVKIYCRERDETTAFLQSTDRALQHGLRSQVLSISLNQMASLIGGIGSTIVYCGSAWCVLKGTMTYGDMTAMDTYVWQAINPAVNLTMVAGAITQALVSLDRILELYSQQVTVMEKPNAVDLPPETAGDLHLKQVHFAYKPEEPLFRGLDLHLPAGKMTALVGHTGCGKTTVTGLLLRLWDVQQGTVTIDGHDIRDITLRSLRWNTGVVPQEPIVFEGTVFDNIAYGMQDATEEQVEEAARAAQIHEAIMSLPDGYRTWLGKEGAKLSVGEKQRISIARAILRKPSVLILDEATSSLDSESETAIQAAMRIVLRGRTSIVVAHRLSTIVEADQIVAMDKGRIVEMGTHDELMQIEHGYYRKLYEELQGKQEQEATA